MVLVMIRELGEKLIYCRNRKSNLLINIKIAVMTPPNFKKALRNNTHNNQINSYQISVVAVHATTMCRPQ